ADRFRHIRDQGNLEEVGTMGVQKTVKVVQLKLDLDAAAAHDMLRVARWEKASEGASRPLTENGSRAVHQLPLRTP
ncbi:MAG: hypothetical protein DI551_09665, partial [Micavibrio aeruginosavorus]